MRTLERLYYFITETRAKDNWCRDNQAGIGNPSWYPFSLPLVPALCFRDLLQRSQPLDFLLLHWQNQQKSSSRRQTRLNRPRASHFDTGGATFLLTS